MNTPSSSAFRSRSTTAAVARTFTATLLVTGMVATAWAAPPLQVSVRPIAGDLLKTPADLAPASGFAVAKQSPLVEFAVLSLPNTPADPWSIWGYGLLHSNGKFYLPVGDHLGVDANAYIYEYDPSSKTIRPMADIQSAVKDFQSGDFGFGKIHGRLNEGPDGKIYFATYWGQWRTQSEHYRGDRIFRYDPQSSTIEDLGMPLFGWGYPSTHMAGAQMLFYAEAHERKGNRKGDPDNQYVAASYSSYKDPYHVKFMVYDLKKREVIFHGAHEGLTYGRDFFVDGKGNAYWNSGNSQLEKYDVQSGAISTLDVTMPGKSIRRTIGPDRHGVMYAVTHDTHKLFRLDPQSEEVRTITTAWADSPAMDVTADGKYVYYVPGGHGPSSGTPLIQVNVADGSQKVLAFLHAPVWEQTGFNLGGTYCLRISPDGSTVHVGFNGKANSKVKAWGDLALVVVHIPAAER